MTDPSLIPADYAPLLAEIGGLIHRRQQQEGWGTAVIPRLARELHNELPEEKGFSERNIKRMLAFHREYPQANFVPQAVAQLEGDAIVPQAAALFPAELLLALPWGHHAELMAKVKEPATRQWYMQTAVRGINKPIGVSTYELTRVLPAELQTSLPSIESIELALANDEAEDEA